MWYPNGGECSSTAIRARIKKLIAEESTHKPLSDSKIAACLERRLLTSLDYRGKISRRFTHTSF